MHINVDVIDLRIFNLNTGINALVMSTMHSRLY